MVAFAKLDLTFLLCPCSTVTVVRVQPPPYSNVGVLYPQELVLLLLLEPTYNKTIVLFLITEKVVKRNYSWI